MTKFIRFLISLTFILSIPNFTFAADEQTHIYGSFFFSMASDLDEYYATEVALGNGWIDGGLWTHPMGLMVARLKNHFLGTPLKIRSDGGLLATGTAISTIEHPFFHYLLEQGLKTKNKAMIGAALHRLIDTFFHSGFSNMFGHVEFGHRPDMPHEDLLKAKLCFQAIIEINFLLRDLSDQPNETKNMIQILNKVPESTLSYLFEKSNTYNFKDLALYLRTRPSIYAEVLWHLPQARNAFFTKIENSIPYQELAFKDLFSDLVKSNNATFTHEDYNYLTKMFSDLHARSDFSVQDSLKITLFRILQSEDPILKNDIDYEVPKSLAAKIKVNKILNISEDGLQAKIDTDYKANLHKLSLLKIQISSFLEMTENNQQSLFTKNSTSYNLTLPEYTLLRIIVPEIISWERVIDSSTTETSTIENMRLGDITDDRDTESWIEYVYNKEGAIALKRFLAMFDAKNDYLIDQLARAKALAEVASEATINITKDSIPNSRAGSAVVKVNFEDDKRAQARFAIKARVDAVRNLIASSFGINFHVEGLGTIGAFKRFKAKLEEYKYSKNSKLKKYHEKELEEIDLKVKEYLLLIGMGHKDSEGNITLPLEVSDLLEVAPDFTTKGVWTWMKWSIPDFNSIFLKSSKTRNKQIQSEIQNGTRMKSWVEDSINKLYYQDQLENSSRAEILNTFPIMDTGRYASLNNKTFRINPKGNNVIFPSVSCRFIFR